MNCTGWMVVLEFNAALTNKVISWRSVTHMCFLASKATDYFSHMLQQGREAKIRRKESSLNRVSNSHASAEVRGENTPERKFVSTGYRTHNHQVMSPTRSPLSQPGGAKTNQAINQNMQDHSKLDVWSIDLLN